MTPLFPKGMTDAIRIVDSADAFAGSLDNNGDGEIACVCVAQDSAQLEELISLAKNGRSKHHGHSSRSVEYWAPDDW